MESEKSIEKYLKLQMQKIGGDSYKFVSPQRRGVPDRICIFPDGTIVFIEVKSEGEVLQPHQAREAEKMRNLNLNVSWVDTKAKVDSIINRFNR